MKKDLMNYPDNNSQGDYIFSLAQAGVASIPFIGAASNELLKLLVTPSIEKRRTEWFNEIGVRLKELETKGVNLEELQANEAFIDVVIQATKVALGTNEQLKKEALRNAIINAASPEPPELALQQMFINYIEAFTTWHLKILNFFSNPKGWAKKNDFTFRKMSIGSLSHLLEEVYVELRGKEDFYNQIWRDLHNRGLVHPDKLHGSLTGSSLTENRVTSLGANFMKYMSE